jgi:hypothetical protein
MKRLGLYILFSVGLMYYAHAQRLKCMVKLPSVLRENSGIAKYSDCVLYFINDGGGGASLYRYDLSSDSWSVRHISDAQNRDWEELTTDDTGNVYIGDFGNNYNARKDLFIYKIVHPEMEGEEYTEKITFTYSNQKAFPTPLNQQNFDCEAMVWYADSIYLFTKNRTTPFDGWSYMYVLPATGGDHKAQLRDSVLIKGVIKELGGITSADVRGDSLVLLSSNKVLLDVGFGTHPLGHMKWKQYKIHLSQKETILFAGRDYRYVSDEYRLIGNKLYRFKL